MPGLFGTTSRKGRVASKPSVRVMPNAALPMSLRRYLSGRARSISSFAVCLLASARATAAHHDDGHGAAAGGACRHFAAIVGAKREALHAGDLLLAAERLPNLRDHGGCLGVGLRLRLYVGPAVRGGNRVPAPPRSSSSLSTWSWCPLSHALSLRSCAPSSIDSIMGDAALVVVKPTLRVC